MRNSAARSSAGVPSAPWSISSISGRSAASSSWLRRRRRQQVVAADERDDLVDSRHPGGEQRLHRRERLRPLGNHMPSARAPSPARSTARPPNGHLDVAGELAEHLGRGRRLVPDHLGHATREAVRELELGQRAGRRLGDHVDVVAVVAHRVVDLDVAVDEDPVPRHHARRRTCRRRPARRSGTTVACRTDRRPARTPSRGTGT